MKLKSAPRYGVSIRKALRKIKKSSEATYYCKNCQNKSVKKSPTFCVWKCKICDLEIVGNAYQL